MWRWPVYVVGVVMNTIVRSFMPVEQMDWIKFITDEAEARRQEQMLIVTEEKPVEAAPQACCISDPDRMWQWRN